MCEGAVAGRRGASVGAGTCSGWNCVLEGWGGVVGESGGIAEELPADQLRSDPGPHKWSPALPAPPPPARRRKSLCPRTSAPKT